MRAMRVWAGLAVGALAACSETSTSTQDSALPDVQVQDAQAPDVQAPDVQAPDVQVPDVPTMDAQAPDVPPPDVQAPDVPDVQAPDVPDVQAPDVADVVDAADAADVVDVACSSGATRCGEVCVDTRADPRNCGACGRVCCPGQVCAAGECVVACGAGMTLCWPDRSDCSTLRCADTQTDRANCGMCGTACAAGQVCSMGACVSPCAAGQTMCGTTCVDVRRANAHCGACGNACATGTSCNEGACAPNVTVSADRNLSSEAVTPGRTCAEAISWGVVGLTDTQATLSIAPEGGCLAVGDTVMLMNAQGAPGTTANVGVYELLRVGAIEGAVVRFQSPKTRRYGAGASDDTNIGFGTDQQRVFLQRVPVFGTFSVDPTVTVTVSPWGGLVGGVMPLRAARMTIEGTLSVSARGYRDGRWSVDDSSCSENLPTQRGESIEGPPTATTSASAGASGGMSAVSGVSFNGNTPLSPSAGHATAGEAGQNPNGRTLGAPGGTYGVADGSRVTLGSGSGGNLTCRVSSSGPFFGDSSTAAGGAVLLWADVLTVTFTGAINASAAGGSRSAASGGYVFLRANTANVGTGRVTAQGAEGVTMNSGGTFRNRAGDGYVSIVTRDALTGTTQPAAAVRRVSDALRDP